MKTIEQYFNEQPEEVREFSVDFRIPADPNEEIQDSINKVKEILKQIDDVQFLPNSLRYRGETAVTRPTPDFVSRLRRDPKDPASLDVHDL